MLVDDERVCATQPSLTKPTPQEGGGPRSPALIIEQAHPPNVPGKVPFAHEVGEHGMVQMRRSYIHRTAGDNEMAYQVWWMTA
jgi:hypothetical protein